MMPSFTAQTAAHLPRRTVSLQVAPIAGRDVLRWSALLEWLPAVDALMVSGFDGVTASFELRTAALTSLHTDLRQLAGKLEAILKVTTLDSAGLQLKPAAVASRAWGAMQAAAEIPAPDTAWTRPAATTPEFVPPVSADPYQRTAARLHRLRLSPGLGQPRA